ncbi:hypothetical protein ACQYWF_004655 [Escherichia coli]|uniref:hypothetical protein n=1 Tax=Escherichia coli TaxID=562 RepID=UPI00201D174F|nr:hypothetical protein [Escherichia coli]
MIRISANAYYKDTRPPGVELCLDELFYISGLIDVLLGTKKSGMRKDIQGSKHLSM